MKPRLLSNFRRSILVAGLAALLPIRSYAESESSVAPHQTQSPTRSAFRVTVRDITTNLKLTSFFVLPGDTVRVEIADPGEKTGYDLTADSGAVSAPLPGKWSWVAPAGYGTYDLNVSRVDSKDTVTLRAFVMYSFDAVKNGRLNGYLIGSYPKKPYRNLPVYKPPPGFVEVTPDNEEMLVTPHFRLGQFVCKQDGDYPKYVVLRELLLLKLELILDAVNQAGYSCSTFTVLSGYRTPHYNKSIGNVRYSRHLWGGAADIFIDENPQDGIMDDLNRDGKINWKDAAVIYDIIDDMYGKKFYERFVGGLARYKKTKEHGPFVHVDVRGFRARWGD